MLLSHQGDELDSEAVAEAFAASWHLGTVFPSASQVDRFFGVGLGVADFAIMASKAEEKSQPLVAALEKALEAARLWPGPINDKSSSDLVDLESSCQVNDLLQLRSGGISALSQGAQAASLRYREIAEGFLE